MIDSRTDIELFYDLAQVYAGYTVLLHLIMLAAEHHSGIMRPLHYVNWCRQRRIVARLIILWLLPFLFVILGVFEYLAFLNGDYVIFLYHYIYLALVYLSFFIMTVIYAWVVWEVKKQQRQNNSYSRGNKRKHRALITTLFVLLSFLICWAPLMVCWVLILSQRIEYEVAMILSYIVSNITGLNSICDPMIYSLRMPRVRRIWRKRLCCCFTNTSKHSDLSRQQ